MTHEEWPRECPFPHSEGQTERKEEKRAERKTASCELRTGHLGWRLLLHIFADHSFLDRPQILVLFRQHTGRFRRQRDRKCQTENGNVTTPRRSNLPGALRVAAFDAEGFGGAREERTLSRYVTTKGNKKQKNYIVTSPTDPFRTLGNVTSRDSPEVTVDSHGSFSDCDGRRRDSFRAHENLVHPVQVLILNYEFCRSNHKVLLRIINFGQISRWHRKGLKEEYRYRYK